MAKEIERKFLLKELPSFLFVPKEVDSKHLEIILNVSEVVKVKGSKTSLKDLAKIETKVNESITNKNKKS